MVSYCVMEIGSQRTVYLGPSIGAAAKALVPGTCYGSGKTNYQATVKAEESARSFFNNSTKYRSA